MTFKKGDRVEFDRGNGAEYGVIFRGGKRPTVYLDGGEKTVTGGAGAFNYSNHPLPTDEPSVMDKWGVKSYKDSGMGEETPHFQAEITLDGKKVLDVTNHGSGGPNMYYGDRALINQLNADAKVWGKQFGYPYDFEVEDTWVEWAAREKKYGKLAVDYFKEYPTIS